MNDASHNKLNFRFILESPAKLSVVNGVPTELASSLMGRIRHCFRTYLNVTETDEDDLFGTPDRRGRIVVKELAFQGSPDSTVSVAIDRLTGVAKSGTLTEEQTVPAGSTIVGAVWIDAAISDRQRMLLESAILTIELTGLGRGQTRGYGQCRVDFVDLTSVGRVFISYTWEDESHNEWVLQLADRLTKEGISVVFDRYDLSIGDNVHTFMERAVERANKVLLILTPNYKDKATARRGGAGFEFSLITSELFDSLAENKKFLPVLRRGDAASSVPPILKPYMYCNMVDDNSYERAFTDLYAAVLGAPSVRRPQQRV